MEGSEVLYREANLFSHGAIWLAVICLTFSSVYFALPQIFAMASDRSPPTATVIGSSAFIAVGFALPVLLLTIKLRIQVRSDGLYVKVLPFHFSFKKIPLAGLQSCEPYMPSGKGQNMLGLLSAVSKKSYSLGGRKGIRMEFKDGHVVFLESRRPEKIAQAIKTAAKAEA
ncbi:MAG TPA: DUF6141 family protein [Candidatus Nitrosotalea sp.]|nr:DUF6141 family protein [Candidatus Nitrosotalea sp.]